MKEEGTIALRAARGNEDELIFLVHRTFSSSEEEGTVVALEVSKCFCRIREKGRPIEI